MKRTTVTAIIIAVLLTGGFAFYKLNSKVPTSPSFTLIGEWRLDSAYAPDAASDSIQHFASTVYTEKEENRMLYRFLADSTLEKKSSKDHFTEKYYLKDSVLYILGDSAYSPYLLTKLSDSLVHFTNSDNVVFILRRK